MSALAFRLLGPVEVHASGRPIDLGPPQRRCVLAALLVDAGRVVPLHTLVDRIWGGTEPAGARQALYAHVARLRRTLGVPLTRRSGGYVLDVDPELVDAHRFQRMVRRVRPDEPDGRVLLREALDLWRGEPLAGVPGAWAERTRQRWLRQRVDAVVAWARAELDAATAAPATAAPGAAGRRSAAGPAAPATLVPPLTDLAEEYPLVESVTAVLMRALYASGQTAEALRRYADLRARLADELGADPGTEVRELHLTILQGARSPIGVSASGAPAQLPSDVPTFAGRRAELRRLDAILASAGRHGGAVIVAVSGTAGVGKTALAVHWSHRVRASFPDGQIYLNLRGYDPGGAPASPDEALGALLDALGVPRQRVPATAQARAGLYRSVVDGRRILVVLDNARDAEQVRPLLPGAPGALALVTSRDELTSLVASAGAHPVPVDLLAPDEAAELLTRRLGAAHVAADPSAVEDIVGRCAGLPLALTIVAARAAVVDARARPSFTLATLAGELRGARNGAEDGARNGAEDGARNGAEDGARAGGEDRARAGARDLLDAFDGGDAATDVRTVFSWSYDKLSAPAATMLRRLGAHPGPDIALPAAASLAAVPLDGARRALAELGRAHLVVEHAPGRFTMHDLLRAYAAELAGRESPATRRAVTHRLLDHYVHSAVAAAVRQKPDRESTPLDRPRTGVRPEAFANRAAALEWFAAEHRVLLGVQASAAAAGRDRRAWQLGWATSTYFDYRGHWHDWLTSEGLALAAAQRLDDRAMQAYTRYKLARVTALLGRYDEAQAHIVAALDLFGGVGDSTGLAHAHITYGLLLDRQGRHRDVLHHTSQALELYRKAGDRRGEAYALNGTGWCHAQLGELRPALARCRRSLRLHQAAGNAHGESEAWDSLGYVYQRLGRHGVATACYARAVAIYREVGDRHNEAQSLERLGDNDAAAGDVDSARVAWRQALEIFVDLDQDEAATALRMRIEGRPGGSAPR